MPYVDYSAKKLAGRLARWATVVQGENLKIIHKSGKKHVDADALSRYPIAGGNEEIDEHNDNYLPLCSVEVTKTENNEGNLTEFLPDLLSDYQKYRILILERSLNSWKTLEIRQKDKKRICKALFLKTECYTDGKLSKDIPHLESVFQCQ